MGFLCYEMTRLAIVFYMVTVSNTQSVTLPDYTQWTLPLTNRSDLYCPTTCLSGTTENSAEYTECCACDARPCWDINATLCGLTKHALDVEYISVFGEALLIGTSGEPVDIYVLDHSPGRLTSLPQNICDFNSTLVRVDIRYNLLTNVDIVKCLWRLDTLILDNNQIETVSNTSFSNMTFLRVLSLANNQIQKLGPNTIQTPGSHILYVIFSNNSMYETDVTNVFDEGPFCARSYDGCDMGNITNELGFILENHELHGPGRINLNNTNMGHFLDFTMVGITEYSTLSKFSGLSLNIDSSSIYCDCNLYHLFFGLKESTLEFWPNLDDEFDKFLCKGPEHMKDVVLKEYFRAGHFDNLTCGLVENCEDGCTCVDIPGQGVVKVDCTNRSLHYLPDTLPVGKFGETSLILLVDENNIDTIDNRPYLSNLKELVMVDNKVSSISGDIVQYLMGARLDIRHQQLTRLPRQMQLLNPRNIEFGDNAVVCDCDNSWIGEWIRIYGHEGRLNCYVEGNIQLAELVTRETLQCSSVDPPLFKNIAIPLALFLILAISLCIIKYFWFELFIIKRKLFDIASKRNPVVFVSMCENNDAVFYYVNRILKPCLEKNRVEFRIPWFHCPIGENVETSTSKATKECDVFVVFFCEKYLEAYQSFGEFDMLWKEFKANTKKTILVVNWAGTDICDIGDRRLKALCKTGFSLDFKQTESKLRTRLMDKLCPHGYVTDDDDEMFGLQINGIVTKFIDDSKDIVEKPRFRTNAANWPRPNGVCSNGQPPNGHGRLQLTQIGPFRPQPNNIDTHRPQPNAVRPFRSPLNDVNWSHRPQPNHVGPFWQPPNDVGPHRPSNTVDHYRPPSNDIGLFRPPPKAVYVGSLRR